MCNSTSELWEVLQRDLIDGIILSLTPFVRRTIDGRNVTVFSVDTLVSTIHMYTCCNDSDLRWYINFLTVTHVS